MGWRNASGEKIKLPKIVLNVRDIVLSNPFLYLEAKRARRLIANGDHQTSFCFLRGPKIQSLKSCDTIGIGGAISSKDGLTPVCTLNLQGTIKKWQVTIHDPTREDFHPVFERGKYGVLTFLINRMGILLIYRRLFGAYSNPQTPLRYIVVSFNIDGAIIKMSRSKNPAKFPNAHLQDAY